VGPLGRDGRPLGLPFMEMAAPDLPGFAAARAFAF
jgi:protein-L-isoaspartate(D-aspartate) O-methyltransferase